MGLRTGGFLAFKDQVIFEYLDGPGDSVITSNTDDLIAGGNAKGITSHRVTMKAGRVNANNNRIAIMDAARDIEGRQFRLYLQGHGDWQMTTLGGRPAITVAENVATLGLKGCQVISILGCKLALSPKANGTGQGTQSFAKDFHSRISSGGTLEMTKHIPVFARTKNVSIYGHEVAQQSAELHAFAGLHGLPLAERLKKVGGKDTESRESKKVYYWQGKTQMMTDASHADDVVAGLIEFSDYGEEA
ncbi:MAG: hypothetical protein ACRD3O_19320 [Terriglobia bacterium]